VTRHFIGVWKTNVVITFVWRKQMLSIKGSQVVVEKPTIVHSALVVVKVSICIWLNYLDFRFSLKQHQRVQDVHLTKVCKIYDFHLTERHFLELCDYHCKNKVVNAAGTRPHCGKCQSLFEWRCTCIFGRHNCW